MLGAFDARNLLTVDPLMSPARVKVVSVRPSLVDKTLVITAPGRGSLANARANPAVTVVSLAEASGRMSLNVDGGADCAGEDVRVTPTGGVLHKPG